MSKELELLKRTKILLECMPMEPLQRQADAIIKEIQELLAQPEQEPLSDDEIDILWGNEKAIGLYSFARVIEKHHGITGVDSE